MALSTLLVATSFPVVEAVAGAVDSAVLATVRFALATLLFLPLVALRHRRRALPSLRSVGRYAALSAPLAAFFYAMFEALRSTTAVHTGALFTFAPGFAALFSRLLLGERLAGRLVLGLATGMLGASWVVVRGDLETLGSHGLASGDGLFLLGTASLGAYSVLVKRLHRGEPMEVMTLWTLLTGTVWLLAASWSELARAPWRDLRPEVLGSVAYLAVFTTLATFLLSQSATIAIGPTRAMAYTFLNPSLVAGIAWATGTGGVGWAALPGVALTLLAVGALQSPRPAPVGETRASLAAGGPLAPTRSRTRVPAPSDPRTPLPAPPCTSTTSFSG